MTVRMVATDLDGTLLRSDGSVSERTSDALRAARDAGLLVAFVTGRPTRWLTEVIDATGHVGIAVAANGAVLVDLETEDVIATHPMSSELMAEITAALRAAYPEVVFALEYGDSFAAEPGYVHDWQVNPRTDRAGNLIAPPRIAPLDDIVQKQAVKLLAKNRSAGADEFLAGAETVLAGRVSVTHSSSAGLLEIAAPGVTKASGLEELAARHGIEASEIVAIGDMPNDIPMLHWAGRSYAVGNAHPAAQEAADEVVGSNDEHAVAIVIESLLSGVPLP